eukprot:g11948.t1
MDAPAHSSEKQPTIWKFNSYRPTNEAGTTESPTVPFLKVVFLMQRSVQYSPSTSPSGPAAPSWHSLVFRPSDRPGERSVSVPKVFSSSQQKQQQQLLRQPLQPPQGQQIDSRAQQGQPSQPRQPYKFPLSPHQPYQPPPSLPAPTFDDNGLGGAAGSLVAPAAAFADRPMAPTTAIVEGTSVDEDKELTQAEEVEAMLVTKAARRATRRFVLPFLFAIVFLNYLDRANLAYAFLDMQDDLGLSDRQYGQVSSFFFLGYAAGMIPLTYLVRRIGYRFGFCVLLLGWALAAGSQALVTSSRHFLLLRAGLGMAESAVLPLVNSYFALWCPKQDFSAGFAAIFFGMSLAAILGGPLAAAILYTCDGWYGLAGWRWLFFLEACPSLLLGLVCPLLVAPHAGSAWFVPTAHRHLLQKYQAQTSRQNAGQHVWRQLWPVLRSGTFARIVLVWCTWSLMFAGLGFWLPVLLKSTTPWDSITVSSFTVLPTLISSLFSLYWSRRADRRNARKQHALIVLYLCAAIYLATSLVLLLLPWLISVESVNRIAPVVALVAVYVACAFLGAFAGPFYVIPLAIFPQACVASGTSVLNSLAAVASFPGPLLLAQFREGSLILPLLTFGCLALFSSLLLVHVPDPFLPPGSGRGVAGSDDTGAAAADSADNNLNNSSFNSDLAQASRTARVSSRSAATSKRSVFQLSDTDHAPSSSEPLLETTELSEQSTPGARDPEIDRSDFQPATIL